jgi:hypothetical protein
MDRTRLVFAVHALVAAGLLPHGGLKIAGGAVVSGLLNVVLAGAVVAVGYYVAVENEGSPTG